MSTGTDTLISTLDLLEERADATASRNRTYEPLDPRTDTTVLDVGCGTGRAVAELAELGAVAVGIDTDERMIEVARGRYPRAEFHIGDAAALPFPAASVTGYRADKVLHQIAEPEPILTEAAYTSEAITREEADAWTAEQTRRADTDRLFVTVPTVLASGRRP